MFQVCGAECKSTKWLQNGRTQWLQNLHISCGISPMQTKKKLLNACQRLFMACQQSTLIWNLLKPSVNIKAIQEFKP